MRAAGAKRRQHKVREVLETFCDVHNQQDYIDNPCSAHDCSDEGCVAWTVDQCHLNLL